MKRLEWGVLAAIGWAAIGAAAPANEPARTFQPQDVFALRFATDPQIRPDGKQVAYVRSGYDIMTDGESRSIWLADLGSGQDTPLVAGAGAYMSPRWSPDGTRIAYIAAGEGEKPQLYVRWLSTGTEVKLTTLPQSPRTITWSPDGTAIAFSMFVPDDPVQLGARLPKPAGAKWSDPPNIVTDVTYRADGRGKLEPGHSHIFLISASGGAPQQVTYGSLDESGSLSFSPDGKSLYFAGDRSENWQHNVNQESLQRVTIADGTVTTLTPPGPLDGARLSPDGSKIAFISYEDKKRGYANGHLYLYDVKSGKSSDITPSFDRTLGDPQWADDHTIYVQYADHGVIKVAKIGLDGKLSDVAQGLGDSEEPDRPYAGGQYSVAQNGTVAFTDASTERPSELAVAKSGSSKQITHLNDLFFGSKSLGKVAPMPVKSSFDQLPIDAWIVTPPDFDPAKKYPLILEIHGGPFAAYGPSFATDMQLYAAAGYVVVYSNPRGSTSYGDKFANEIDRTYPSHDYDDLMSVVDSVIAKGFIDSDNLFVTGGSGGGLLTAWIVGKTDRFRAAVAQKPVINWQSEVLTTDGTKFMAAYWFGKTPWEDPQGYWARSPLSLVGNVVTPTMVVVGEADYRTPVSESEQFYQALQLKGVPTALMKVPGASHGGLAGKPSQSAEKAEAIIGWFEKYKKK
jgi:dipeptidyl aminopeptidase/acylaminoacyl peptidase